MYHRQLKIALEERLSFYEGLMERLRQSIEEEDSERIEYYRGLEQETLRSLSNLEKCIAALSQRTLPAPNSSDERGLDTRVAQARSRALEAARANCALLRRQLSQLQSRITSVRAKSAPSSYADSNPLYLDLDI